MHPKDLGTDAVAPADAVAHIRSGMHVFVHGNAATPQPLLDALCERTDLEAVVVPPAHPG